MLRRGLQWIGDLWWEMYPALLAVAIGLTIGLCSLWVDGKL